MYYGALRYVFEQLKLYWVFSIQSSLNWKYPATSVKLSVKLEVSIGNSCGCGCFQIWIKLYFVQRISLSTIMSDAVAGEKPLGRPMKYPYTFSAKIAQFPLKFYLKNQWVWRYYFIALGVSLPIFYKIHKLANSPANKAKWAEAKAKEAAEHHH